MGSHEFKKAFVETYDDRFMEAGLARSITFHTKQRVKKVGFGGFQALNVFSCNQASRVTIGDVLAYLLRHVSIVDRSLQNKNEINYLKRILSLSMSIQEADKKAISFKDSTIKKQYGFTKRMCAGGLPRFHRTPCRVFGRIDAFAVLSTVRGKT